MEFHCTQHGPLRVMLVTQSHMCHPLVVWDHVGWVQHSEQDESSYHPPNCDVHFDLREVTILNRTHNVYVGVAYKCVCVRVCVYAWCVCVCVCVCVWWGVGTLDVRMRTLLEMVPNRYLTPCLLCADLVSLPQFQSQPALTQNSAASCADRAK